MITGFVFCVVGSGYYLLTASSLVENIQPVISSHSSDHADIY